jgi:ABC-type nitrate/sulfonate/bicarbonate transport system substrate-binding protein
VEIDISGYRRLRGISRITLSIIILVIVALAGVSGLYLALTPSASQALPVIRVGTTYGAADSSDVPSVYAMTVLLKQMGYTVDYTIFTGQSAAVAALTTGEIDVLQSSPIGPIAATAKGASIFAFGAAEDATDEIMVCTSNITSMAQLVHENVTVAVTSFTDSSYYYPVVYLTQQGLNPNDVHWVFVPGAAGRGAALLAGSIPCGATDVGSTLKLLAVPGDKFHVLMPLADMLPTFPLNLLFTTNNYAQSHSAELVALLEAYINANRWAQSESAYVSYAPTVIGATLTTSQIQQAWNTTIGFNMWNVNQPFNTSITSTISNVMGEFKLGGVTSAPTNWYNFSYYQQALAKVGSQ